MPTEEYNGAKALRVYYQTELEGAIDQMKIEGATLEEVVVELHVLAEWLVKQAADLQPKWETLLTGTPEEQRVHDEIMAKFGLPPRVGNPHGIR